MRSSGPGPARPDAETCDRLLAVLAELVASGGAGPLLAVPVVPDAAAFPERWRATPTGATLLLRRLAWHARLTAELVVSDDRISAPPMERRPPTRVELVGVRRGVLEMSLIYLGRDDVVGTLAHEIGVAHVALAREAERAPYRTAGAADSDVAIVDDDLVRGSLATVYLGLGVLAANAAFQQYSGGKFNGAYIALEYDVLTAGYAEMSELAFLLAVQAVVRARRHDRGKPVPPDGLSAPQRDEVVAWIAALRDRGDELCTRLGIADAAEPAPTRPIEPLDDPGEPTGVGSARVAFRWRRPHTRSGVLVGGAVGLALAAISPARPLLPVSLLVGTMALGFGVGRRTHSRLCSFCMTRVSADAMTCTGCNSLLHGDISRLEDRLETTIPPMTLSTV